MLITPSQDRSEEHGAMPEKKVVSTPEGHVPALRRPSTSPYLRTPGTAVWWNQPTQLQRMESFVDAGRGLTARTGKWRLRGGQLRDGRGEVAAKGRILLLIRQGLQTDSASLSCSELLLGTVRTGAGET